MMENRLSSGFILYLTAGKVELTAAEHGTRFMLDQ